MPSLAFLSDDMTDSRQLEKALEASECRYLTLMKATSQVDWVTDPFGNVVEDNPRWREFTGQTYEQIKGSGWLEALHPEDRAATARVWAKATATLTRFDMEYRIRRHDGVYRTMRSQGLPILEDDGSVREWIGACTDITDRKQAEAGLARSEALFRRMAEANLIGVGFGDIEGNVTYVNDEMLRMMGHSREDFEAGRINWQSRIAPEFTEASQQTMELMLLKGAVTGIEQSFIHPDGKRSDFLGAVALFDPEQTSFVGVALDQTEAKRAEAEREGLLQKLRVADQKKDEFLAMLAHELKNPLAAVRNAVMVLKLADDVKRITSARDVIDRQTSHLSHLVDDLLDVSRITNGKIRLNRQLIDAVSVLRRAAEVVEPIIKNRQHSLVTDFADADLQLSADPSRLEQMVVNLLTNAAKYTQNGGRIKLCAKRDHNHVVISVEDDGAGIPPDNISEMFQLFSQADRSLARSEGGLGIGLTIVKSLAEMHGGSVMAESDGLSCGSTFTLRLPAANKEKLNGGSTTGDASPAKRGGARVLVVDDNRDTAVSLAEILKILGHRVEVAYDGYEAIKSARNLSPDFVLLDIGLPGLDGYEVARRLRQEPGCKSSTIVAVTGYGQDEDRHRSQEAGFDHHLVKPVEFDKLAAILALHA